MPADPFDVKLTQDPAGTPIEIGLMLARDEDGKKQYVIGETDTGQEVEWVQTDFRGGMVDEKVQPSGTNEYGYAVNFMADHRTGSLVSGPDFKEASTVGVASLDLYGGIVHDSSALFGPYTVLLRNNQDIYKSSADGTTFSQTKDVGGTYGAHSVGSWNGYALIGCGTDQKYFYSPPGSDGDTWIQSTLDVGGYHHFFVPGGDVLWGLLSPSTVRWSTDPSNTGSWSGATTIGEVSANDGFVGGFFISQILVLVKTMGVFTVDDGGNIQQVVNLRGLRSAATDYTSKIYLLDWGSEVWEYDIFGGSPLRSLGFQTAVAGHLVLGGTVTSGGLQRSFDKIFVTSPKGVWQWSQFRDQNGSLAGEAWENLYYDSALADLKGAMCSGHRLSDSTTFKSYPVYVGGSATATKMGYVRARRQRDISDAANLSYTVVDSVVTSGIIDHGKPNDRKQWQYAEVNLGGSTLNARLAYSVDGAGFANLGATAISATGKTLLEFPSGTDGYRLQLRLTNDPSSNNQFCELLSWSVRGTLQGSYRRRVQVAARIGDGITVRSGAKHHLKGDVIRSRLQTARTTGARLQLEDYLGNSFDVVILSPLVEVPSRDERLADTESEMQFTAVEYGVATAT